MNTYTVGYTGTWPTKGMGFFSHKGHRYEVLDYETATEEDEGTEERYMFRCLDCDESWWGSWAAKP